MATTARPGDRIEITAVQSYEATWDDTLDRLIGLTGVLIAVNDSHLRENERTGTLDCAPFEVRIDRDAGIDAGEVVFAAGVRLVDAGMQEPAPSMSVAEAEAALAPLEAAVRAGREAQQTGDRAALRDRIAAAMREHYLSANRDEADADGNMPCRCGDWREPGSMGTDEEDWDAHLAGAVLAVLYREWPWLRAEATEPTDQAAVRAAALREAADRLDAHMERFFAEWPDEPRTSPYVLGWKDAEAELRRLADEQQAPTTDPIPLRWGLDDIEHGDDDTVTVLLSGPDGWPYWLELDPERADALRDALTDPDKAQQP